MLYPAFATTSFQYVGVTLNLTIKGGLDQWYFETYNRHPLCELRPSVAPASESDSDEPAVDWSLPSSRSTLRTIREIYKLMAADSLEYYQHFNAAAASTRAAVGPFIFQMKTLRRWRETYLFQVNLHPPKRIICYAQDKQLAASLGAWRRSTAAAHSKSSQYKQMSWSTSELGASPEQPDLNP